MRVQFLRVEPARLIVAVNLDYFNARFIDPTIPKKELDPAGISFNTGYFHKGRSLGDQWYRGVQYGEPHQKGPRPQLILKHVATEAGPTLIVDGRSVLRSSTVIGGFEPDVARKTKHVAVGYASELLILAYYQSATLEAIASELPEVVRKELNMKLDWAMNCDGGGSAHLHVLGIKRGRKEPVVGVELSWK